MLGLTLVSKKKKTGYKSKLALKEMLARTWLGDKSLQRRDMLSESWYITSPGMMKCTEFLILHTLKMQSVIVVIFEPNITEQCSRIFDLNSNQINIRLHPSLPCFWGNMLICWNCLTRSEPLCLFPTYRARTVYEHPRFVEWPHSTDS